MEKSMRLLTGLLAAVLLLTVGVQAFEMPETFEGETPETLIKAYMETRGLHEGNFAMSYYNTVTGEAYAFNDTKMMVAASTYKLPLNMYYYELERDGKIASDAYIPRADSTLDVCHRESLVNSNNDLSIGLLYNLGNFRTYKDCMRKYFTMTDAEIDPLYYADNYYCVRMMMDALRYLYENSADFEEMLDYMKLAQPGEYFEARVSEYEIAHKYGWFEGAVNDTGIFYTPQPFLLAVYTQDVSEAVVGEVAELMTEYTVWQHRAAEEESARLAEEEAARKAEEEARRKAEEEAARQAAEEEAAREAAEEEAAREAAEEAAKQAEEEAARKAEDEAVRQAAMEAAAQKRRVKTIIGIAVVAVLLIAVVLVLCSLRKGVRHRNKKKGHSGIK